MAGALKSPKRKPKQQPFKPSRAARIETIEDDPAELLADPSPATGRGEPKAEAIVVKLALVDPSPTNPRKHFDEQDLADLAATIKSVGLIHPLMLRPSQIDDARYELVAGERRFRAAKLAGLAEAPATLRPLTDAQVIEIQSVENLQRQDISPIEEARAFRQMCLPPQDGGLGYTQTQLAARLGCKQAHISNRVRLLELPEACIDLVDQGKLPPTHARDLLRYRRSPKIMEQAMTLLEGDVPSQQQWEADLQRVALRESVPLTRSVILQSSESRDGRFHRWEVTIDKKDPRWSELEVIELQHWGRPEQRALNTKLAKQLLSEKERAWHAKHAKPAAEKRKDGEKTRVNAAQKRADARAERAQLAREVKEVAYQWRLADAAERFARTSTHGELMRLLLYCWMWGMDAHEEAERVLARKCGIKETRWLLSHEQRSKARRALEKCQQPTELAAEQVAAVLRRWAGDHEGLDMDAPEWEELEPLLPPFDAAAAWRGALLGARTETYFELHSEAQLRALCEEWELEDAELATAEKPFLIEWIVGSHRRSPLPLPRELAELFAADHEKMDAGTSPRPAR